MLCFAHPPEPNTHLLRLQLMDYDAFWKRCTVKGAKMHMKILLMVFDKTLVWSKWDQKNEYSKVRAKSKGFF